MPIPVICTGCQRTHQIPEHYAGKRVRCPKCGERMIVPTPELLPAPQVTTPSGDESTDPTNQPRRQSPSWWTVAGVGTIALVAGVLLSFVAPPGNSPRQGVAPDDSPPPTTTAATAVAVDGADPVILRSDVLNVLQRFHEKPIPIPDNPLGDATELDLKQIVSVLLNTLGVLRASREQPRFTTQPKFMKEMFVWCGARGKVVDLFFVWGKVEFPGSVPRERSYFAVVGIHERAQQRTETIIEELIIDGKVEIRSSTMNRFTEPTAGPSLNDLYKFQLPGGLQP